MSDEIAAFIKEHERTVEPLYVDYNIKFWELSTNASDEREKAAVEAKQRYLQVYSNKDDFRRLRAWRPATRNLSDVEARQFKLIYDTYVPNQMSDQVLRDIVERDRCAGLRAHENRRRIVAADR